MTAWLFGFACNLAMGGGAGYFVFRAVQGIRDMRRQKLEAAKTEREWEGLKAKMDDLIRRHGEHMNKDEGFAAPDWFEFLPKEMLARASRGEPIFIGAQMWMLCTDCRAMHVVNKRLFGSIHFCRTEDEQARS